MADLAKVKRNIQRMIDQNAPESDIDAYVDGEGTSPEELRAFKPQQGAPAPRVDTVTDMAKGFGAGVGQGVIGLAGSLGDVRELNSNLFRKAAEYVGAPQWAQDAAAKAGQHSLGVVGLMPTSETITKGVESVTGPIYKAQSTPGQYAQTLGNFVPAAVTGPGGMGRKVAAGIGGALASEMAGQATKGTEYEPWARLGAGLVGGGLADIAATPSAIKQVTKSAPTFEQVAARKNELYGALDNAGVKFDSNSYAQMLSTLAGDLKNYRATKAPMTADTVQFLVKKAGVSPTFRDIEDTLSEAKGILREKSATDADKAAAGKVVDRLTKFFDGAPVMTNGSISADQVSPMVREARDYARRHIMAKQVNRIREKSEFYVSGDESGMRNQFAAMGKNSSRSMSKMEKDLGKKVVRREGLLGITNQAGSRLGQIALGSTGFSVGGIPGALLAMGAGMAARKGMEMATGRAVQNYEKAVLAGRAAQEKALRRVSPAIDMIPRAGLFGNAALLPVQYPDSR